MSLIYESPVHNRKGDKVWNVFDKIVVLTIPSSDVDEIKENMSYLPNYFIATYRPANKTINGGDENLSLVNILQHNKCDETCQNITSNHIDIIRRAYNEGRENVLIFEDDVNCLSSDNLKGSFDFVKSDGWDVFFLGYCQWPIPASYMVSKNIVRLTSPMGTMSYCLSRTGMKRILNYSIKHGNEIHIDKIIGRDASLKKYGVFPSIAYQNKPPALFQKALTKLPFTLKYSNLSKGLEYASIIIPVVMIYFLYTQQYTIFAFLIILFFII